LDGTGAGALAALEVASRRGITTMSLDRLC
jgi:hypothetical protein